MKFWIKELTRLKVLFLFIVPNAGHKYTGDLLSFDKVNFKNLLESNGYELILKRSKYLDPYVQKYGLNPTIYYLFKNINDLEPPLKRHFNLHVMDSVKLMIKIIEKLPKTIHEINEL